MNSEKCWNGLEQEGILNQELASNLKELSLCQKIQNL